MEPPFPAGGALLSRSYWLSISPFNMKHCTRVLADQFHFVSVCPEVAIGLGVPRAPIQLVETKRGVRVRGIADRLADKTDALDDYGCLQAEVLGDICGYIFKARSPSCGLQDVDVWDSVGQIVRSNGIGAYAHALLAERPLLPIADEKQLQDEKFREQFIHQVYSGLYLSRLRVPRLECVDFYEELGAKPCNSRLLQGLATMLFAKRCVL